MNWTSILNDRITRCRRCPRLVAHCQRVAVEKKRAFRTDDYWGRPVPGFGDPAARVLIIGLAPAAHGANRTGRMFTGDQSGRWLFRALSRAGFAVCEAWERRTDGQQLRDCYLTAVTHCAPPANKPRPVEIANCGRYLEEELRQLVNLQVVVTLGQIAFQQYLHLCGISPRPVFGHNRRHDCGDKKPVLISSYHPSRQNTNTGRLTEPMLDAVFESVRQELIRRTASASRP